MTTEVLITVDTEFSIAGAFDNAGRYEPLGASSVEGRVGLREHGLGFILDALNKYGIDATFFVEAINTCYFGHDEMGRIAQRIIAAGQDVQLHVHPVWAVFDGNSVQESEMFPRNDSLVGRNEKQVEAILDIGMASFRAWGLSPPVAVRTGSLFICDELYPAFRRFGLRISSSVGMGICRPPDKHLWLDSGKQTFHGVSELPVTTFRDLPGVDAGHRKTLQITSCSWPEIKGVLLKAHALGIPRVILLTHPFEFFKRKDFRHSRIARNRVNQGRLIKLCEFLSDNQHQFTTTTFASGAPMWSAESDVVDPLLASPHALHCVMRKLHNGLNDAIWAY